MEKLFQVQAIGEVKVQEQKMGIQLDEKYMPALQAMDGFSHLCVIWWCHGFDNKEARSVVQTPKPYKKAPDTMGIFATRSPVRPNPIGLTVVEILAVDYEKGYIQIDYIDAYHQTPVLDIKPYTPSNDRVEAPEVPGWCRHWPGSLEAGEDFDWEAEFNF